MSTLEHEISIANMIAKALKIKIAVIQFSNLILAIEYDSVEMHETVLYVTI